MSNLPYEKWYWKEWLSDPQLRQASPATRGIWADLLGYMWQDQVSKLVLSEVQFKRLAACSQAELEVFFQEAQALLFCDASRTVTGEITVASRRRQRQDKKRENSRLRSAKYRASRKHHSPRHAVDPDPDPDPKKENPSSKGKRKKAARAASSPAKPAPPPPVYPEGLNVKAWELYVQHRRQLKKNPFTDLAADRAMKKLMELGQGSPSIQQAVVDQTLENNWVGLVGLKEENHHERRNVSPIRPADASEYTPDGKIRSH